MQAIASRKITIVTATIVVVISAVLASQALAVDKATKPPVKIGAALSLSGPFAALGIAEKNAIVLATRQLNAKGGINGRRFSLEILDDQSNPTIAATNAQRLVQDGVVAIIGATSGGTTPAVSAVAARSKVLQIAPTGADSVGETSATTLFHVPPTQQTNAAASICGLSKITKAKKIAVMYDTSGFGIAGQTVVPEAAAAAGITIVDKESFAVTATDMSVQWAKIRASSPDAVLIWAAGGPGANAIKQGRALGINVPFFGSLASTASATWLLGGAAAENMTMPGFYSADQPVDDQAVFTRTYNRNYKADADFYAAMGYDAVNLIATAIKGVPNAQQKDGVKLAKALEKATVNGVVKTYAYKGNRDGASVKEYRFYTVKNGKLRLASPTTKCT